MHSGLTDLAATVLKLVIGDWYIGSITLLSLIAYYQNG